VDAVIKDVDLTDFQIEKDYYVSVLLKELAQLEVPLVFKGGTSLSKCYDAINRFSEDIDLAMEFPGNKAGEGLRKRVKYGIITAIEKAGLEFINPEHVQSDRDFNRYHVKFPNEFETDNHMVPDIIIETIAVFRPYPIEKRFVNNYITKFLRENDELEIIERFDLEPFEMNVQSVARTFIDKLFALCDYHKAGKYHRYSRHIYDVHKIWINGLVKPDELLGLIDEVARDRQLYGKDTLSAQPGFDINATLQEIIDEKVFESDYENLTSRFIFDEATYSQCIESLQEIINLKIMPENIKEYR
jgi:hypothetical protein